MKTANGKVGSRGKTEFSLDWRQLARILGIGAAVALISILHFQTVDLYPLLHELTQRLYYLPIIYAAWRFGLRGGIGAALASVLFFVPHMRLHIHEPEIYENQTAEMILFLAVGIVTGLLSDSQKRERARYEQTVNQLVISDRLASLGQLSAGLVHEIRNPLASIRGAAEALESEIARDNKKRVFLSAITGEVDRLNTLITDFLTFARPRIPEMLPTHPNAVVRSVVSLTSRELELQQLSLVTELDEQLPTVLMDGEQIKQALLNLVINAIQATPRGRQVKLSTSMVGKKVCLTVQDSGPGIPSSMKPRLFTPFVTTKDGGTGLGLVIALSLVKQHDGTITTFDVPEGGSIFQIELPFKTSSVSAEEAALGASRIAASS